jgi:hypothetical protein
MEDASIMLPRTPQKTFKSGKPFETLSRVVRWPSNKEAWDHWLRRVVALDGIKTRNRSEQNERRNGNNISLMQESLAQMMKGLSSSGMMLSWVVAKIAEEVKVFTTDTANMDPETNAWFEHACVQKKACARNLDGFHVCVI